MGPTLKIHKIYHSISLSLDDFSSKPFDLRNLSTIFASDRVGLFCVAWYFRYTGRRPVDSVPRTRSVWAQIGLAHARGDWGIGLS